MVLTDGTELIGGAGTFERLRLLWRDAAFSEASDVRLERYFCYQLEGISKLSDTLYFSSSGICGCEQQELLSAIRHLFLFHHYPAMDHVCAPRAYHDAEYDRLGPLINNLRSKIASAPVAGTLSSFLTAMLTQAFAPDSGLRVTYATFSYNALLVDRLSAIGFERPDTELILHDLFLDMDLNHLGVFHYLRNFHYLKMARSSATEKLEHYREALHHTKQRPYQQRYRYHPDWPSLQTMMLGFFQEELARLEAERVKMPLDISVAQLACLLAALQEEGIFGQVPVAEIIRFFARNFSTKRQQTISPGGLSKEYYGISQVTAAVVKDKFSKMAARITRRFFPG